MKRKTKDLLGWFFFVLAVVGMGLLILRLVKVI